MLMVPHLSLIPNALQLGKVFGFIGRKLPCAAQHGFAHFLAIILYSGWIDLQCFKQDILLGIHDAEQVFEALTVVVRRIHMDVQAAGRIDFGAGFPYFPDAFLKLG